MAKLKMTDVEEVVPEKLVEKKIEDGFFPIEDLPSLYKLYPEGTKISGRPLKVSDVKKLTTMNSQNFNQVLKDVLVNTIRGIDVDDICTSDKLYIIFWLRANTYKNANFTANYSCEACGKSNSYKFDVDRFDVEALSKDSSDFSFRLINKDNSIVLDFPRIRDEERVKRFQDSLKNSLKKFDDETVLMASMIKSIDSGNVSLRQACEFVETLENFPEDYAQLYTKVLEMDFGIVPEVKHTCTCGEVNSIPVSFRSDFFLPKFNS